MPTGGLGLPFSLLIPANTTQAQLLSTPLTQFFQATPPRTDGYKYTNSDASVWIKSVVNKLGGDKAFTVAVTGQPTATLITSNGTIVRQFSNVVQSAVTPPGSAGATVGPPANSVTVGPAVESGNPAQQQIDTANQPSALESLVSSLLAPLKQLADAFTAIALRVTNTAADLGALTTWFTDLHTIERLAAVAIGLLLLGTGLTAFLGSFVTFEDIAKTVKTVEV